MVRKNTPFRHIGMLLCISLASLGFCFGTMARQTAPKGTAVHVDSVLATFPVDSIAKVLHARTASLMNERCAGCHGGKRPRMGLSLEPEKLIDAVTDVRSREIDSLKLVDTRVPERSYLLMKVRDDKGIKGSRMPDDASALSAGETKTIDSWIQSISGSRRGPRKAPSAAGGTRKQ